MVQHRNASGVGGLRPAATRFRYLCSVNSRAHQRFATACFDPAFALLLTAIATGSGGCGGSTSEEQQSTGGSGATGQDASAEPAPDSSASGSGGATQDASPEALADTTYLDSNVADEAAPVGKCSGSAEPLTHDVSSAPVGTHADPASICVATAPVSSNTAARVTFNFYSQNLTTATGHITLAPALLGQVAAPPTVEVTQASPVAELTQLQVSGMQATADGFAFNATWPASMQLSATNMIGMTVKTTLQVTCPGVGTQTVESITYADLCGFDPNPVWVSSGDSCTRCEQICEMAPTPIVPAAGDDDLPLACALRVDVVAIAQLGDTLVLFADRHGVEGDFDHAWQVSGGQILYADGDLAVWRMPDEPGLHQAQVGVQRSGVAAVAALRWKLAA